ncbi:MAG: tetratricopeptide repeat protein, partial [Acidobacteriota bacterium]
MPAEIGGFIVDGQVLPNPLRYARDRKAWGTLRTFDAAAGFYHGDLNTNNVLARFSRSGDSLEGYYLIDFSLFKEDMPLFYDQRYLEMSYLAHVMEHVQPESVLDLIGRLGKEDELEPDMVPIDMAGVHAVLRAARGAFRDWLLANHPSLQDDLWGQYWLAGAAAGLNFCHKASQKEAIRLGGLVYAASSLKRFFDLFAIPLPEEAGQLSLGGGAISIMSAPEARLPTEEKSVGNLPIPLTGLVGRTSERVELTTMVMSPELRLLSLTGPGGTGKTRLAIETARKLQDQFADGVYFVDLAPITDPDLVTTTIAHAMGVREAGVRASLETLKEVLAQRERLLVLDNVEQVVAAGKDLSEILASSPGLKILVTSRIPLHLRGEREYPVLPLSVPPEAGVPLSEALGYDAVTLFCRQARFVKPSFDLNRDNQDAVMEICRQLDGLPLAIEIAAARVNMLPPQTLLKRLDHRLDLLVGRAQDLPDRQQTMRGTIDWSFDLLDPSSKAIFTRLGVFAGGFTLDAAETLCRPMDAEEVFSGVETLLDNSMLRQVDSVGDEPRFEMLQTLREYALEQAEAEGVVEELRRVHCGYFTQMTLENKGVGVFGAESGFWLKRYEEEHDNFRLALTWAFDHPQTGAQSAIAMMSQLTWFWYRRGYLPEGNEWTKRAVVLTEPLGDCYERAFALTGRAMLALWSGDLQVAESVGREGLDMAERMRLEGVSSVAKLSLGTTLVNQGRHTEAYPLLVDAVELFDQQDDVWFKGTVLVHLANVSLGMGNPSEALQWLDTALPLLKETGDIWNMAFGMNNYGEVARVQEDYEKAEEYYRRTEALYQQADAKGDQARLVHSLGYIALHKGDNAGARALFLESLAEFRKLGNHRGIAECLAGLAGVAVAQGK